MRRKIISAAAVLIVILSVFSLTAFADTVFTLEELNLEIKTPDSLITITRDSKENDPVFKSSGLDYKTTLKTLEDDNVYLYAQSNDGSYKITVGMVENDESRGYYDFTTLSSDQKIDISEAFKKQPECTNCYTYELKNGQAFFFCPTYKYNAVGGTPISVAQYITIINGQRITTQLTVNGSSYTNEQVNILKEVVDSMRFTDITTKSFDFESVMPYIYIACGVFAVLIIVTTVLIIKRKRAEKNPEKQEKPSKSAKSEGKKDKSGKKENPDGASAKTKKSGKKSGASGKRKSDGDMAEFFENTSRFETPSKGEEPEEALVIVADAAKLDESLKRKKESEKSPDEDKQNQNTPKAENKPPVLNKDAQNKESDDDSMNAIFATGDIKTPQKNAQPQTQSANMPADEKSDSQSTESDDEFVTYESMDYEFNDEDFVAAEGSNAEIPGDNAGTTEKTVKLDLPKTQEEPLANVNVDVINDEPIKPEDIDFSLFENAPRTPSAKPLRAHTGVTATYRREARPSAVNKQEPNETRAFEIPKKPASKNSDTERKSSQNPALKVLKAIGGAIAGIGLLLLYLVTLPFTSGKNKNNGSENSQKKPKNNRNARR
ncbi:MAG: hypothetical protein K6F76_05645 [Clostridiales bacterium]|nr:hypothetical protein [Clostridiales bacterium]